VLANIDASWNQIVAAIETIDRRASSLGCPEIDHVFGDHPYAGMPRLHPATLGFITCVSWLYMLYHEIGTPILPFLVELLPTYGLNDGDPATHYQNVQRLRTFLQHHLSLDRSDNRRLLDGCGSWFLQQCRTKVPTEEEDWAACLNALLLESVELLSRVEKCLRAVETDESNAAVLGDLVTATRRYHSPESFDRLIEEVAADMGRDDLDPTRLRKRYYDRWSRHLKTLGTYDFLAEGRRLIEQALLADLVPVLPVDGRDVIRMGISPGPEVARILVRAKQLYEMEGATSRDDLIDRLKGEVLGPLCDTPADLPD
jgi:hypothetical protein